MRFNKLTISLDTIDIQKTLEFYKGLGFQVSGQDTDENDVPYWIEIKRDELALMLYQAFEKEKLREFAQTGFYNTVLYFEIENVEAFYKLLKEKGYVVEGLEQTHYGSTECYLKDPDGHQLTFGTFKNAEINE